MSEVQKDTQLSLVTNKIACAVQDMIDGCYGASDELERALVEFANQIKEGRKNE